MNNKQPDGLTRVYQNTLLVFGIMLIGFSINQLRTIWTSKSSLISLSGTLSSSDISTTTSKDRRGHKSQSVAVSFTLTGQNKRFIISEHVGQDYSSDKLSKIHLALRRSEKLKVWIKKTDKDEYQPKVFQIDNEKRAILDFESVRSESRIVTAFMLTLGIGSIILFIWLRYPDKLKKAFE